MVPSNSNYTCRTLLTASFIAQTTKTINGKLHSPRAINSRDTLWQLTVRLHCSATLSDNNSIQIALKCSLPSPYTIFLNLKVSNKASREKTPFAVHKSIQFAPNLGFLNRHYARLCWSSLAWTDLRRNFFVLDHFEGIYGLWLDCIDFK